MHESPLEIHRPKLRKFLNQGDYASAVRLMKKLVQMHPQDFEIRMQYAKVLGDWADELPPAKREKFKKESVKILKPLIRQLRGKSPNVRFSACINYYYQTESYLKMYRYGQRQLLSRELKRQGHYSMGLAAAHLGLQAFQKGQTSRAQAWGRKSIRAWQKYDLKNEPYYFAHYALAMAQAVAGDKKARSTLQKAAKMGKRPVTDWEFQDVLSVIQTNERKQQ